MQKRERKLPSDWERITITLPANTNAQELYAELDKIVNKANKGRDDNAFKIKRNQIFVEALMRGIKALKNKYKILV